MDNEISAADTADNTGARRQNTESLFILNNLKEFR